MINIEQCRAARGLLNWTQSDLAAKTGLSKTAINNFERRLSAPHSDSLKSIRAAFEDAGLEFIPPYGVNKRVDTVTVLKGPAANGDLWDDIVKTLKPTGGEVLITHVDEARVIAANPDGAKHHIQRLNNHRITERLLACDGANVFLQPRDCYRWLPSDLFTAMAPIFVFGDKVAMKFWDDDIIIVVHSNQAAEAERKRFNYIWDHIARPVPNEKE